MFRPCLKRSLVQFTWCRRRFRSKSHLNIFLRGLTQKSHAVFSTARYLYCKGQTYYYKQNHKMASSMINYLYDTSKKDRHFPEWQKKGARFDLNNDILKQKDFFMHSISYSAEWQIRSLHCTYQKYSNTCLTLWLFFLSAMMCYSHSKALTRAGLL